jgi:hypothetical protein
MACSRFKTKEERQKARKTCVSNIKKRWDPVNVNLPKKYQPAQTQEFFDRYTRKK